jgi:hypothetical protein
VVVHWVRPNEKKISDRAWARVTARWTTKPHESYASSGARFAASLG